MNILLVNDDGWDAPGIAALERVAQEFGEVWSVAPLGKMSGCGHQLTLHQRLRVEAIDARHFKVDGSPADCVRVGLSRLGVEFDWVWSGINEGSNLGCDVYRSGTVAAAREAALLGIRSIALSQYQRAWLAPYPWSIAERTARLVLAELVGRSLSPPQYWNVNFPDQREQLGTESTRDLSSEILRVEDRNSLRETMVVDCAVDSSPLVLQYEHEESGSRYRGVYFERPRQSGSDIDHCFNGRTTISRLGPE